jgi:hypothetical protein
MGWRVNLVTHIPDVDVELFFSSPIPISLGFDGWDRGERATWYDCERIGWVGVSNI